MVNSIQHFLKEGTTKIQETMEKFWTDPSKMAEMVYGITSAVTDLGLSIIAEEFEYCDGLIRDSDHRKKHWYIVRRDENTILTSLGPVTYNRTLFKNRRTGKNEYLLDRLAGISAHERMTEDAVAKMLDEAVESSYRKGGENACITQETASAQTAMNKIRQLSFPKIEPPKVKRRVDYLYVDCDEDHVSLQHVAEGGSHTALPKMIYVYEGEKNEGKRRELVNAKYFGGLREGGPATSELWEEASEYIQAAYDTTAIKKVFINGDGANWIKGGVDHIANSVYVLDKFHMSKYIQQATCHLYDSAQDAKALVYDAIRQLDKSALKEAFELILKDTDSQSKKKSVLEAKGYLLSNWNGICAQQEYKEVLFGCSAEGHISHVYSDRMSSRPLGWSRIGVDRMARLRVYKKNGGSMLDLVRLQELPAAAGAEEPGFTCADLMVEEHRQKRNLGNMYGTKIYSVPQMISKMLSIKEHIWRL